MTETATRATSARPVPEGYHTLTPTLTVHDAAAAIDFYQRAFGATEFSRAPAPDGQGIWHAEVQIGDSRLMLNDEFPDMGSRAPKTLGGTPVSLFLSVEDADALSQRAVEAGATAIMPMSDVFWGDRFGKVADPFGHEWLIATRKEDLTEDERRERAQAFIAQMGETGA